MPRGRTPGPPQPAPRLDELTASGVPSEAARLAQRLGRLRVKRGWTHQQLADAAQVNRSIVVGIENGVRDPAISSLRKIKLALELDSWDELLAG